IAGCITVDDREWESASREDRARNFPSLECGFRSPLVWNLPNIVQAEVMADVVVGVGISVFAQGEWVLRAENTEVGVEGVGQEAGVGNFIQRMAPGIVGLQLEA